MNDNLRSQMIDKDPSLRAMFAASKQTPKTFLKEHQKEIDKRIFEATKGAQR